MNTTSSFDTFISEQLNTAQREAIKKTSGPVLIIAGAGSGKTRVITARITQLLLNEQIPAYRIIALTFTNKAATEMKERIHSFLDGNTTTPFVGTFHSYCLQLLKKYFSETSFSILDTEDKQSLLNSLLKKSILYKKFTAQQLSHTLSIAKNSYIPGHNSLYESLDNQALKEIAYAYEREKKASNCLDFDDLLIEAVKLFDNPLFRKQHQEKIRHILVDEYQDTNVIQHELLKKMALSQDNNVFTIDSICAVGDEDQSIYSWRGATVENIMHFKKDFGNTTVIKLEQNYRSIQPILSVANHVIEHNRYRNEKKLWSEKKGRDCVRMIRCLSGYQEADLIAQWSKLLLTRKPKESIGILYRTHSQSRVLEEALIKHSLRYTLIGGIRFYERKEIKDILAYLRLLINPRDRIAFIRAINCPNRGLGEKFVEDFLTIWDQNSILSYQDIAHKLLTEQLITGTKADQLKYFIMLLESYTPLSNAIVVVETIIKKINYYTYLQDQYEKDEATERQENIKEFINAAHYFASQGKSTLNALLEEVALLQEHTDETDKNNASLYLMTLHAAKGLEFDSVIITGLEENLFPSSRATNDPLQLEEERRLFYVGITRARSRLLLSFAHYRQTYGQMDAVAPSRFSMEIPSSLCKTENASTWRTHEGLSYFSQWLGGATPHSESTDHIITFSKKINTFKQKFTESTPKTITTHTTSTTVTSAHISNLNDPFDNDDNKETASTLPQINHSTNPSTLFKKYQTVKHSVFGVGIVKEIEERSNGQIVTAQFKNGIKKIDSKFLKTT